MNELIAMTIAILIIVFILFIRELLKILRGD